MNSFVIVESRGFDALKYDFIIGKGYYCCPSVKKGMTHVNNFKVESRSKKGAKKFKIYFTDK